MKIKIVIASFIVGILLLFSFQKIAVKSQEDLIKEYISEHVEEQKLKEWEKCHKNTVLDAERFVDSIIYRQVNFNIGDTLKAPGKPVKPTRPFDTLRLDSTPIVPMIEQERN